MVANSDLAVIGQHEPSQDEWSEARKQFILKTFCGGADEKTAGTFLELCQRRRLSPEARHVYLVNRARKNATKPNWVIQTGIDGYRLIADRTGRYAGSDDPVFIHDPEGGVAVATVTVRKLISGSVVGAFTASARWDEYAAEYSDMWKKMPHTMLAKCFDPYTEVLTDHGFEAFSQVTGRILQVGTSGLEATDAKPFSQPYDGEMISLFSDDLNFCVTPNHDMVTTDGKIEAGDMFDQSRARARYRIPRLVSSDRPEATMTDGEIALAAAYLCDGQDRPGQTFCIEVSRYYKIDALRGMELHFSEQVQATAGETAHTATRTITTRKDKTRFTYTYAQISPLCRPGKQVNVEAILNLSQRQARVFVDTLITFDGHTQKKSGVRRFYTSNIALLEAFEVAAVHAGLSVSPARARYSDIGTKPNYSMTVSDRDAMPVIRWGRAYNNRDSVNAKQRTGLELTQNYEGIVWCVTVPSGVIVVRRDGFSMLCGNCAEALALRKAFPEELAGLYTDAEMDQADAPAPRRVVNRTTGEILDARVSVAPGPVQAVEMVERSQLDLISALINQKGLTAAGVRTMAGGKGARELTWDEAETLIEAMHDYPDLVLDEQEDEPNEEQIPLSSLGGNADRFTR